MNRLVSKASIDTTHTQGPRPKTYVPPRLPILHDIIHDQDGREQRQDLEAVEDQRHISSTPIPHATMTTKGMIISAVCMHLPMVKATLRSILSL